MYSSRHTEANAVPHEERDRVSPCIVGGFPKIRSVGDCRCFAVTNPWGVVTLEFILTIFVCLIRYIALVISSMVI